MLEFRDLRSGIWVKILVVVFHRPKVHILHRQMFPFRVAGWQHLGVWPLVDQEFGLGGFGIRPNSEVGIWRIRDLTKKVRFLVLRCRHRLCGITSRGQPALAAWDGDWWGVKHVPAAEKS